MHLTNFYGERLGDRGIFGKVKAIADMKKNGPAAS
jgi:hypothetical protein